MKKSIFKAFIFILLGIIIGVVFQTTSQKIRQQQQTTRYEIVVAPTRKRQINYVANLGSVSFDNPKKKLCVVIYDHKEEFYELCEITPAY